MTRRACVVVLVLAGCMDPEDGCMGPESEWRCDRRQIDAFVRSCMHDMHDPSDCHRVAESLYCDYVWHYKNGTTRAGRKWQWRAGSWHLQEGE